MTEIIAAIIVWVCATIITVIWVAVLLVAFGVYYSITWPWYLYRAARRIALPR